MFEIKGADFEDGVVAAGTELICEYEILDSGNIVLVVTVPSIGGSFHSGRNFYSRREGLIDYSNASKLVVEQANQAIGRLDDMAAKVEDERLDQARERLERAASVSPGESDTDTTQLAMSDVQEAKRLLAMARKDHLRVIRKMELDHVVGFFDEVVRQHARSTEESTFDNLAKTAQRAIDNNSGEFEAHLDDLRHKNFMILWRQDWFVIDRFKRLAQSPHLFQGGTEHAELVVLGLDALKTNDIDKLRTVVSHLNSIRIGSPNEDDMMSGANIVRS